MFSNLFFLLTICSYHFYNTWFVSNRAALWGWRRGSEASDHRGHCGRLPVCCMRYGCTVDSELLLYFALLLSFSLRASFHFCIIFQSSLFRNLPHTWLHDARASAFAVQCARPTLSVPSSRSSRITWPSSKNKPFWDQKQNPLTLERVTCLLYD